ncbi:hypothetical protein LUZ61_009067 [Rhynchospora tenuis]|uniref:SWIM-type domain-containing protein n=1 Tax=Rhynchospora tenuis TaxID=198213 RepID=A0AAD5ZWJ4_9POAL|nr:hypothetical protein LUZ61_009067 [Rhynchospora tenuis]
MVPLLYAICRANPGSKLQWFISESSEPNVALFRMVSWAFGPAIKAFAYCRPVIGIDGTHLSGRYKGKLLTAYGYDADGHVVPLAFALVHEECNETWGNFMKFVRTNVVGSRKVCVISDRHASILRVFKEPDLGWNVDASEALHRYCSRHVVANFQDKFGKSLVPMVRAIFRQNQPYKFNKAFERLYNKNHEACEWLMSVGSDDPQAPNLEIWSRAHDDGHRWGIMTTNGPESLNNVFREARLLPVTALVEVTFYKSVKFFAERRKEAEKAIQSNLLNAPEVAQLLEKRRLKANNHNVKSFREQQKYEVLTPRRQDDGKKKGGRKHIVYIDRPGGVCTCVKPQLTGLPCSHILAVCGKAGVDSNQFVHGFYSAHTLLQTWTPEFNGFGNPDEWPRHNGPELEDTCCNMYANLKTC